MAGGLSNKKRAALFNELGAARSDYICGELQTALVRWIEEIAGSCQVRPEEGDVDGQTLLIEYPTQYTSAHVAYVAPRVKHRGGSEIGD